MGGSTKLDMSELTSFLQVAAKVPEASINDAVLAVHKAVAEFERQVVVRTPVGASGNLRRTFSTKVSKGQSVVKGELVNPLIYALPVEKGRKPGRQPPTTPIEIWVRRKLGISDPQEARSVAFVIARAIGRRGTKAVKMVEEGLNAAEPTIYKLFDAVADGAIEKLGRS